MFLNTDKLFQNMYENNGEVKKEGETNQQFIEQNDVF
jgi:hypothetical protein